MDLIRLAMRQYEALVPDSLRSEDQDELFQQLPESKIEAWFSDCVLPAIDELWQRPIFRNYATWPQRMLAPGAETETREMVERMDACLIEEAKVISQLGGNRQVADQLDRMLADAKDRETREPVEDGWMLGLPHKHVMIPYYRDQLESIATGCWTDLVCVDDYFGPAGGMMRCEPLPEGATEGAMVVSHQAHLRHVGDLISRCMLQRVRSWTGFLAEARAIYLEACRGAESQELAEVEAEQASWIKLQECWNRLLSICVVGAEARTREACMIAVQVVADFHPSPDLDWLGLDPHTIARFHGQLRATCVSRRDLSILDRIAAALNTLHNLYQGLDPTASAVDEAIASGGLVMIEKTRKVYWECEEIGQSWGIHRKPWELLLILAQRTRLGASVDQSDLYPEPVSDSTMQNRPRRLKELLPPTLARLIVPGHERVTYRLELSPDKVHLFD